MTAMRIAVLGNAAGWHVGRLVAAIARRGHEAGVVAWHEVAAEVGGTGATAILPAALAGADAVVVRAMPAGTLEQVIFRMDVLGLIAAGGTPVVNPPRALETAIDKFLSLARLQAAGIPVPRTIVVQDAAALERAWDELGGDAVVKPLFGSGGQGIERLASRAALAPHRAALAGPPGTAAPSASAHGLCYLQEFVPHGGWDVRVFVAGGRALAMRRVARGDWRTNLALGGVAEPFVAPAGWGDLAHRAARAVGAEIAGVDLVPKPDGRVVVVEVNAVPGWRGLATVTAEDPVELVVDHLESAVREGRGRTIRSG